MSTQKLYPVTEKKEIPVKASVEINRLYEEIKKTYTTFTNAQDAFGEYVRLVRTAVGIPEENTEQEVWDMSEDATQFLKLSLSSPPITVEDGKIIPPAQSADCTCDPGISPEYPHQPGCPKTDDQADGYKSEAINASA